MIKNGDAYGIRTHEAAVKGRCLNRLTNAPITIKWIYIGGSPGIRTRDTLIKSQVLYQLS